MLGNQHLLNRLNMVQETGYSEVYAHNPDLLYLGIGKITEKFLDDLAYKDEGGCVCIELKGYGREYQIRDMTRYIWSC